MCSPENAIINSSVVSRLQAALLPASNASLSNSSSNSNSMLPDANADVSTTPTPKLKQFTLRFSFRVCSGAPTNATVVEAPECTPPESPSLLYGRCIPIKPPFYTFVLPGSKLFGNIMLC
ncbi:MAG: hypothetical protein EOP54_22965 [Sphingobacteriales bacterium]|nr:MAG: hypothetical protein EOP54_22965 [Sphingobacteriales bacterium]